MTVHPRTTNGSVVDIPLFNPFASTDHFWWGYPSFAKALTDTQKAAVSYVEANGKLMDEVRNILAREFDLSLQVSRTMLGGVSEKNRSAIPDSSDANAIFESAITSWRELGEAWMDTQMRSLDAMRGQRPGGRRHARQGSADAE